jgi:hypothetical protein
VLVAALEPWLRGWNLDRYVDFLVDGVQRLLLRQD